MKRTMIRYRTKPEGSEENQRLIEEVFKQLHQMAPTRVQYVVLRVDEDVFVHLVGVAEEVDNPIPTLDAFQIFRRDIAERCLEVPAQGDAKVVGSFGMPGW
ncbi:MAG: hypothetical protein IKE42_09260 [Aquamicrobium sp.]|uniref:hypothetical protein n=1 Tax=Mesorhizobium sp. Pch-S TaxID=2082387 RepID=UPI0010111772|nr:hypothetical protein [Mesorhizobium sp. Pch-S]MBR2688030.1 hypothetical protein [Aquamicrobium sp.]QAZ45806.1 hypothetical protein C1M53_25735 [Mesorhizobium sp. Pch-S]